MNSSFLLRRFSRITFDLEGRSILDAVDFEQMRGYPRRDRRRGNDGNGVSRAEGEYTG
jgi:hypothetical protein